MLRVNPEQDSFLDTWGHDQNYQEQTSRKGIIKRILTHFLIGLIIICIIQKIWSSEQDKVESQQISDLQGFINSEDSQIQSHLALISQRYKYKNIQLSLAQGLYLNDTLATSIEYYFYSKKFGYQGNQIQNHICIVGSQRNNMDMSRQQKFLQSISELNYTNYTLVLIDDGSDDGTSQFTQEYLSKNIQLKKRVNLIVNSQKLNSLANKIRGIKEYCKQDDIIVDVDADDHFIGKQILHIINKIYSNQANWFFYSNYLTQNHNILQSGPNEQIQASQIPLYRISGNWKVSHLKTYRRKLFMKFDDQQWKNSKGQIYPWAADRFILYGLIEMAGKQHIHFQNIYPYFYNPTTDPYRNFDIIKPFKLKSMLLTPYQSLKSLKDSPVKKKDYSIPSELLEQYGKSIKKYQKLTGIYIQSQY